jgi:ribose transport system permease protein
VVTTTGRSWSRRRHSVRPAGVVGPAALLLALFWILVVVPLTGHENGGLSMGYLALQSFSFIGLLALGLALTVLAGELDLSVVGMFAFGGGLAITMGDQPLVGVVAATLFGIAVGAGHGWLIGRLGLNSMTVTVGTYIALLGATSILGDGKTILYDNFGPGLFLDTPIFTVFSVHSLIAIGGFVTAVVVIRYTRFGRDLYAVGNDRRAAATAGVRVDRVLVVVFAASGMIAALAGALQAYSTTSASPDPGTGVLVLVTSAVLLGGIAIDGGEGSLVGVAAAAIALNLLQQLTGIFALQDHVSSMIAGTILIVTATLTAPRLREGWRRWRPTRTGATVRAELRAPTHDNDHPNASAPARRRKQ